MATKTKRKKSKEAFAQPEQSDLGIRPYEKNAKEHTDKQLLKLAEIVREVGWRQPVIVNQQGVIIVGHGRYFAWQKFGEKLGLKKIWIMNDSGQTLLGEPETKPMTEEQEKTYRLADNQLNALTGFDMDLVIPELKLLSAEMLRLTGFDANLVLETKEDNPDLSAVGIPRSQLGDVYELGPHKLICGDATDPQTYEKLLGDERARLIFTDPPYSVDYLSTGGVTYNSEKFGGTGGHIFDDDKTPEEALIFYRKVAKCLFDASTLDCVIYWWFADKLTQENKQALQESGWYYSQTIIWLKNSLVFMPGQIYFRIFEPCMVGWKKGEEYFQNETFSSWTALWTLDQKTFAENLDIIYAKRDATNKYIHPTQKPVQLAERAIKRSSEKNDIVLDAFGGSGSTMIACDQLERRARLIELDPKYVDAIVSRWCKYKNDNGIVKNGELIQW